MHRQTNGLSLLLILVKDLERILQNGLYNTCLPTGIRNALAGVRTHQGETEK